MSFALSVDPEVARPLADLAAELAVIVDELDPASVSSSDAVSMLGEFVRIERLAGAGKALLARRAADASAWKRSGAKTAAEWLAKVCGVTVGDAARLIAASEQVAHLDDTRAALADGALSTGQLTEIASAATADRSAEQELLDAAATEPLEKVRTNARRVRAAAEPDPEARRREAHRRRSVRLFDNGDGSSTLHARGPADVVAEWWARIGERREARFAQARREGVRDSFDAYSFDALDDLINGTDTDVSDTSSDPSAASPADDSGAADTLGFADTTTSPSAATATRPDRGTRRAAKRSRKPKFVLVADLAAILRGGLAPGERCEIPGFGAYPLDAAIAQLGDAILHLVITRGTDVRTVITDSRHIAAAIRTGLEVRDDFTCVVPGCDEHRHLEIDHTTSATGYADTSRTCFVELALVCKLHHRQKTLLGAELGGNATDGWTWKPPP